MKRFLHIILTVAMLLPFGCTKEDDNPPEENRIVPPDNPENPDDPDTPEDPGDDTVVLTNLLLNGGLEEWLSGTEYDMPANWARHSNYNVRKDTTVVSEGSHSARMSSLETGSTARIDQRIPVTPGSRIRIRFHYNVAQWKSKGARTYCYFRTAAAESYNIPVDELKAFYSTEEYYIIRGGGYGLTYLPHDLDVWQVFDETITVPPSATYFVFGINSYHGTTLYVDNCLVAQVP